MDPNGKDVLIEEIDKELRAVDNVIEKLLSRTDALLRECTNETKEAENAYNDDGG